VLNPQGACVEGSVRLSGPGFYRHSLVIKVLRAKSGS
jgi:hypothetical protein